MIATFLDVIFGCSHKHFGFPITAKPSRRRGTAASITGTYIVCLDCGKEFGYDWAQMRVVSDREAQELREYQSKQAEGN